MRPEVDGDDGEEEAYKPPTKRNILEAFRWLMEDLKSGDSTEGMISDNAINDILVKPLIPGVTLHAIVDAFHSGTILDLPWAFCAEKFMTGAMTCLFVRAIWENPDITYQGLLDYMHKEIEKVNRARSPLLKVLQRKIDQEPVLSSSEKFNTNMKFKL
ncbi:hypothetical protein T459_32019 [Capsicum annuum]|uniref:Uncharacterized protein n=1 Tax=Capsicum annuum TaxID=4072 RepID=A0A2G2Y300_CAPAN|nr:hypothetical protein T459_32019 [Capsicum annuum]